MADPLLLILVLSQFLTLTALAWITLNYLRQRARRHGRKVLGRNPIPMVSLGEFDTRFALGERHAPHPDSEVRFIGAAGTLGGVSDTEGWVLSVLAKRAQRIFELGTATGKTTYLLAVNAPESARITTLTLSPEQAAALTPSSGSEAKTTLAAQRESQVTRLYYEGTEAAPKITQLFGDSLDFDPAPYAAAFDLIFIDGGHGAHHVRNDSDLALKMIAPGGTILWHDYAPNAPGVWRELNRLKADGRDLVHLKGTTLVAFKAASPS